MKKSFANLFVGNVVEFTYHDKPRIGEIKDCGGFQIRSHFDELVEGPKWVKVETLDGPRTFTVQEMKDLKPVLR